MSTLLHTPATDSEWWRSAVIYQIYPRSFASSGGPVGDLVGITARLDHLAKLGVDAVWLSPFYKSPQRDAGYDVSDYRDIDPIFGTLDDADALIARSHELGLKIIIDLVPNHTSDEHVYFQEALAAGPNSPARERYWFREGKGEDGSIPPNDWRSIFGGIAWTRVQDRPDAAGSPWENDGQWYLHLFDSSQPDVNWDHPDIHAEFTDTLRFWLDRGVDGFRVDVAHGLVKAEGLPDFPFDRRMISETGELEIREAPMSNQPGVHEIYREWREVLDEYGRDRCLVAEAWVDPASELAKYVRQDEMSQAFNFDFLSCPWSSAAYEKVISESLAAMDAVGAPTTWVISNHDVVRATSRMGLTKTGKGPNGIRDFEEQPDVELGHRRALAAHQLQAALPGSCYIYQGEELALPEHMALPDDVREDPAFFRTLGAEAGRDGCRIPLPWEAAQPGYGFAPDGESWLPQPADWDRLAVDAQAADPDSPLNYFRTMFELRRSLGLATSSLAIEPADGALHLVSMSPERDDVHVVTAFEAEFALPASEDVLLASGPLGADGAVVPVNTTVWYQV